MYFNDHQPPHFHAVDGSDEAQIDIATGTMLRGRLKPASRRLIEQWAALNRDALMRNWERAHNGERLERISGDANDV